MAHVTASEVAKTINDIMCLEPADQTSMLEVISDYFTEEHPDYDNSDCSDLEDDESSSIDVHTQSKTNFTHLQLFI